MSSLAPPRRASTPERLKKPASSSRPAPLKKTATPPSLPAAKNNPRLGGASSPSGTGTPSSSDRLQARGSTYTQKPKPSALAAARAQRSDPESLSPHSSSGDKGARRLPRGGRAGSGDGTEADSVPAEGGLSIDVNSESAQPEVDDDEPFVPEEEEEGPSTQGDHLMMAKAKMRRQTSMNSPGVDSPHSPVRAPPCTPPRLKSPPPPELPAGIPTHLRTVEEDPLVAHARPRLVCLRAAVCGPLGGRNILAAGHGMRALFLRAQRQEMLSLHYPPRLGCVRHPGLGVEASGPYACLCKGRLHVWPWPLCACPG